MSPVQPSSQTLPPLTCSWKASVPQPWTHFFSSVVFPGDLEMSLPVTPKSLSIPQISPEPHTWQCFPLPLFTLNVLTSPFSRVLSSMQPSLPGSVLPASVELLYPGLPTLSLTLAGSANLPQSSTSSPLQSLGSRTFLVYPPTSILLESLGVYAVGI